MAHAWDIAGYVGDACIICDGCGDPDDEDLQPIFEDNRSQDLISCTCDVCGAFTDNNGDWHSKDEVADARWATCEECRSSVAFFQPNARTRLDAIKGKVACHICHGPLHF